ncbi:MAG: hypothetical protein JNK72_26605 [Myxococcales bacterium]|nr:hypothetical protein [Myxococcales bacterium]
MRGQAGWGVVAGMALIASLTGCAPTEFDDDDWDVDPYDMSDEAISIPGRYVPPSSVSSSGDRQSVRYDNPPSWSGGRYCTGSITGGARVLGNYLRANFRGVSSYGGYSCRPNTANRSQLSVHGTGRALDVFIPLSRGAADNTLGDPVVNYLIQNASALGVQFIVWDRSSWNPSRPAGRKTQPYTGPHPHHDHIHVELNTDGAAQRTSWFRGR